MKLRYLLILLLMIQWLPSRAQDSIMAPTTVGTGTLIGISPPLRDIPPISEAEYAIMVAKAEQKLLNPKLRVREYPFAETALPKGPDGVWQMSHGTNKAAQRAPSVNFQGQNSPYYPPDENGVAGPSHYMQTVNTTYAIYSKTGTLLAGPTNMNQLFGSIPGSNCNDGDPIVLYDQIAGRWLAAAFALCVNPNRMLVAVSATDDPTGVWYQYSFIMGGMPDYEKFGVWPDGYYMGTNTRTNTDIYAFEREVMLSGGASPKMVSFNNPWRPGSQDGFMMVPPVDNDGPAAPAGAPGIFIAHQDDAFGGGPDQLWIYELDVDWATTTNSTFTRVQRIDVEPFDSNFGNNWDNIKQPGTSRKLDAIPQVIMNAPKYRNFGTHQTIVACHVVDVDATDHAGVRWYELRKTTGDWTIRQQGTYAPDEHSRWMASIAINGSNEIALGYSISSSSVYPGIRYAGQSSTEHAQATGIMDIPEEVIWDGTASQSAANRWGDYSKMSVDPTDDQTFWYTNQYVSSGQRTRIASFKFSDPLPVPVFEASNLIPCMNETVTFTDQSVGSPTAWEWTFAPNTVIFVNGTSSTSQNPAVRFTALGTYDVSLSVTNAVGTNFTTEVDYIVVNEANAFFSAAPLVVNADNPVIFTDESTCTVTSWLWVFGEDAVPATATGPGPHTVIYSAAGTKTISLTVNGDNTMTRTDYINVLPNEFNMGNTMVSTCSGMFFDSGGPNQNYSNNLNQTMVIQSSTPGLQIQVEFIEFLLENSTNCEKDQLSIYNGTTVAAPLLGTWCGDNSPGIVVSDNSSGALTFVFKSSPTITAPGWSAELSCVTPVSNPQDFQAEALSDSEIQLTWNKNPDNNNVMVAFSNGLIGQPAAGASYAVGDLLPGGGTVIFSGPLEQFVHSGLQPSTMYYYKAFSLTSAFNYSVGIEASASTLAAPPTLDVDPENMNVDKDAGTAAFTVTSNSSWTAETTSDWCTVTPSGNGNGPINVVYEENTGATQRVASIAVSVAGLSPVIVTLTQAGTAPFISVSPLSFNVPAESGNAQATVTSNVEWNAESNQPDWCTVTSSGTGNGAITITYTENTRAFVRNAIITLSAADVSPVTIAVAQEAAEAYLSLNPVAIEVSSEAGSAQVAVTSNFDWTVASDASWCVVSPVSGSDNATLILTYEENTSLEQRSASVEVQGSGMGMTAILTQEAAAASLLVDPMAAQVSYQAGFFDFAVTSNVPWSATADSIWLNVTSSGTGSGVLKVMYDLNPYTIARQAIITITGEGLDPQEIDFLQAENSVGINNVDQKEFKIYPNPANDAFIVEVDPAAYPEFTLQLLNTAGKEILTKSCSGKDKYSVNVGSVNSGFYMVRLVTDTKTINRVLMIAK